MGNTNIISLNMDDVAHNYAKIYASLISDSYQRKRAYASISALYSFIKLVEQTEYNIQKAMTLFRNPILNEQYEICDLYINNWHLDVRVVTGGDAVLVPKKHYDCDIVPDFYVVIKVNPELTSAELLGIADTSSNAQVAFDYNYYSIPFSSLITYEDFLQKIKKDKECIFSENEHEQIKEKFLAVLDNNILQQEKNKIVKHLFGCSECRTEFCCFTGFEMVCCNASKYPEIIDDQTLNIIGAQSVNDKKYDGQEQKIYIGDDESSEENLKNNSDSETAGSSSDDNVSDILDELFSPVNDSDSDLNTIESQNESDIEVIKDYKEFSDSHTENDLVNDELSSSDIDLPEVEEPDMKMIYDNSIDNNYGKSNSDIEKQDDNIENSEVVILDDNAEYGKLNEESNESVIEIMDESSEENNVQKVIVDYDETGEPIYSYITSVDKDEIESIDSEAEVISDYDTVSEIDTETPEINIDYENTDEDILQEVSEENDDIKIIDDGESISEEIVEDNIPNDDAITEEPENFNDSENESDVIYEEKNDEEFINEYQTEIYNDSEQEIISENDDSSENIDKNEEEELYEESDSLSENTKVEEVNTESDIDDEEQEDMDINNSENYESEEDQYEDESEDYEEEYPEEDLDSEENINTQKKSSKKIVIIIISIIALFALISGGALLALNANKQNLAVNNVENIAANVQEQPADNDMFENPDEDGIAIDENNANNEENVEMSPQENNNQEKEQTLTTTLTEKDLIDPKERTGNGDVNKVIANAFSAGSAPITLRNLNWFCTSALYSDATFRNYLQKLDNNLKQNLKNNILNATEVPPQNYVSAKLAVNNNGNLNKVVISESSGSEEIDNIVLQSINETFEGEKSPILTDSSLKSDIYYIKVVIKL